VGGGPPTPLPAGFGGQIAHAQSLAQQCQVLAAWGQPLTRRSDAMTASVDQLQREALPLFEDSAFVPVFGLSYIMTTPEQRLPIYYLLVRDCPQQMEVQTGHVNLTYPWGGSFGGVTAGLVARHEALGKVATASERLPALPETQAGQNELRQIASSARPFFEKLDEKERNDFIAVLRINDLRIANGTMRARIAAIPDLPANDQGFDALRTLVTEIGKSGLPDEEKARAQQAAHARVQDIVQSRIAAINQKAPQMPSTLAGLAEATGAIREVSALAARPDVGMSTAAALQQTQPVLNRRRDIMADPGVLQQFSAAMQIAAKRGTQEAVDNATAVYLLPEDLRNGSDGAPFRAAIITAQQQAEDERVASVLGEDSGSRPQAAQRTEQTAAGEPSSRDMLAAVEDISGSINAGQTDLASRCARREFQNDPGLALMCLGQMGAGRPMKVRITRFRKTACSQAQGAPGWVCDYSFQLDLSTAPDMGYLGKMMDSGGNCTGRFVRSRSHWVLEERSCS
jgi:hypothetical protein